MGAAVAGRDACQDIAGRYRSAGENALAWTQSGPSAGPAPSLASLLIAPEATADVVSVVRTGDGAFRFEGSFRGEATAARSATVTCDPEKASVPGTEQMGAFNDGVTVGTEHHVVELHKADDGTLAVRSVRGGYGVALLVLPATESRAYWYRYAPARDP